MPVILYQGDVYCCVNRWLPVIYDPFKPGSPAPTLSPGEVFAILGEYIEPRGGVSGFYVRILTSRGPLVTYRSSVEDNVYYDGIERALVAQGPREKILFVASD